MSPYPASAACCCANANALLVLPADEAPPVRRKPALPQPPSRWLRVRGPCRQGWENEPKDTPYYTNYCSPSSKPPAPGQMGDMRCNFAGMLKTVDDGFRNVTEALVAKGRWDDTLMVVSSDNGGIGPGNNRESSRWQLALRTF